MRKTLLTAMTALVMTPAFADLDWPQIESGAHGQTVNFHAWGGSEVINDYIEWTAKEVAERYGVTLRHVKVTNTGDVVSQVLAEKTAGRNTGGSVDLVWINGENFAAMKNNDLLFGPFTQALPNYSLVDTENKPTTLFDFTTPVDHMEAPWGMAQLVFMYDSALVETPPRSMAGLLDFARANPGAVTYPAPPSFYGTTFLKQAMLELADDPAPFYEDVAGSDFAASTAPLWGFLDELHPLMWRQGRTFTSGAPEMKLLLNDGEISLSLSFNPNDASNAIAIGELPASVRTYVHEGGTIGNTHFVAIPYNSSQTEGAMVVANFLMSPEAQARKANVDIWGDPTVLAMNKLTPDQRALFDQLPRGAATLSDADLGAVLREPHASWVAALERAWQERYAN